MCALQVQPWKSAGLKAELGLLGRSSKLVRFSLSVFRFIHRTSAEKRVNCSKITKSCCLAPRNDKKCLYGASSIFSYLSLLELDKEQGIYIFIIAPTDLCVSVLLGSVRIQFMLGIAFM